MRITWHVYKQEQGIELMLHLIESGQESLSSSLARDPKLSYAEAMYF